jgi:hypothetical protein
MPELMPEHVRSKATTSKQHHLGQARQGCSGGEGTSALLRGRAAHLLSAFASDTALVLAHIDRNDKSNEIPAVQTLLGALGLTDAVVTVDAMHCQKTAPARSARIATAPLSQASIPFSPSSLSRSVEQPCYSFLL